MTPKSYFLCTLCGASLTLSGLLSLLGGWDANLETLCIFMAVDYILGIVCALVWHKSQKSSDGSFESNVSLKGLFKKGGILLIILIAARFDLLRGTSNYIRNTAVLFFTANEGLSIIENLGIMGLPLPEVLKSAFSALNQTNDCSK